MPLLFRTSGVARLAQTVWTTTADTADLSYFGSPKTQVGTTSVLGLTSTPTILADGNLEFSTDGVTFLNKGSGSVVVVVQLESYGVQAPLDRPARGDRKFLEACEKEAMPSAMISAITDFLARVREYSDDQLVEGKARKWVTQPKNFLAITIQNRNHDFAVHVRKTAALDSLTDLDVRGDRPGYSRFWIKQPSQIASAARAAKASYAA